MSDIRYNSWLHRSGTGGVYQDSSGRIGIGTSVPAGTGLHVKEGYSGLSAPNAHADTLYLENSANAGITIATPNTYTGYLTFADPEDDNIGQIIYRHNGNSMGFFVNAAERLRIDTDGRVMVGNTVAANMFTVANNLVVGSGSGSEGMTIFSDSTNDGYICFADGQSDPAYRMGQIIYSHQSNKLQFRTNGNTDRLTIDNAGRVSIASSLSVTGIVTAATFKPTYGSTGHRNLWINGDMSVAQRMDLRGITSSADSGFCSIDRYYTHYSGGSGTTQWLTFTPGDERSGSMHYMRYAVASASDYTCIRCPIEDVRTIVNEPITVSFDAKYVTNAPNGGLTCWFQTNYGEGGTATGSSSMKTFNGSSTDIHGVLPALTTSWARYSVTFTDIPGLSGKTIGAGSHVEFLFGQGTNTGGTAWNLDITNLQIERGYTATPFEWQPVADTVARCQRYYWGQKYVVMRDDHDSTANETLITTGVVYSSTRVLAHLYWPTTMRARPQPEFKDQACVQVLQSGSSWTTSTSLVMRSDMHGARFDINHGGSFDTDKSAAEVRFTGSGDYFAVNAEMPITTGVSGGVYT